MDKWLAKTYSETKNGTRSWDATPTNFIFNRTRGDVVWRSILSGNEKRSDPVFDIGMVSGKSKHSFLWRTGNGYEATPYPGTLFF